MSEFQPIKKPIGIRILRGLFIGFGLLLLNLIFIVSPYLILWSVLLAAVVSGFSFVLTGGAMVLTYFITLPFVSLPAVLIAHPALILLAGGLMIGMGGILAILSIWITKYVLILTKKYCLWHWAMIKGDDDE